MKKLLTSLEAQYADELKEQLPYLEAKMGELRTKAVETMSHVGVTHDGKAAHTINLVDMKILYLLVRHYQPKVVFEIGTWIGTSALVMAEAMRKNGNGGMIYTCDISDSYLAMEPYQNSIKKITAFSDAALDQIPAEAKIDFIFADGELTFNTIKKLQRHVRPDTVIATHDYELPAEKGVINYLRLQLTSLGGYQLASAKFMSSIFGGETATAIIYRDNAKSFIASCVSRVYHLMECAFLGGRATIVRMYRKFSGYYTK